MKKQEIVRVDTCRICNSEKLYDFLDLGNIPIPNGFLNKKDLSKKEKRYPLIVTVCLNCYLVQLKYIVNPEIMFDNYLYIPSSSKTRLNHFKELAQTAKDRFGLDETKLVVDIGSNDGSLLTCFKNLDVKVLGVDPASNLVKVAELNGVPTEEGYFSVKLAKKISTQHQNASVMLATNVMAHIGDLHSFFKSLDTLLTDDGVFISQFPYALDLLRENQFDTIYHEHLFYFSVKPLMELAKRSNLEIFDIERKPLDGGSIRVYWKKKTNTKTKINEKNIQKILKEEKEFGLYDKKTYNAFARRVEKMKTSIKKALVKLKKQNATIVGYGAAAKGNILLNYFDIDSQILDYVVDSTPYKQGLYTPGTHVPIYEEDTIYKTHPDYLLILAWNFKEEIMEKNNKHKKDGGKFIIGVPTLEIL
jgi:SAM-dependent methyltransferase